MGCRESEGEAVFRLRLLCYKEGMTNQAGRGQPCPCGSGRKYKNCCYRRDAEAAGGRAQLFSDPEWLLMRKTEGEIVKAVAQFLKSRFGEDAMNRALDQFTAGSTIPEKQLVDSIFIPWLVFNWRPAPPGRGRVPRQPEAEQPALAFLSEHGSQLDDYQKSFIRAACDEPFTFFLVTAVEPRRSLTLRDLLLEREVTVRERQATETLKRGNVIYARSVSLAGHSILLGVGPVPLPPDAQGWLLDFRDDLRKAAGNKKGLDSAYLRSEDDFLRSCYFKAADRILNPPPPVLQNTDGDPLTIIQLKYELQCPPEEAVERLKSLVLPEYQEEILDDAEFDGSGRLVQVSVTWQKRGNRLHPEWDNTSLAKIDIRRGVLEIEVNSEKRAKKIRQEIQNRLGGQCKFVCEERQSAEALLRAEEAHGRTARRGRLRQDEGEAMPSELSAVLREQMKAHWDAWLDIPISALRGQTPREAARTPKDRERLEALLMEFEYRNESTIQPELRPDVAELRRRLGLPG
jgi:hypothetical protein